MTRTRARRWADLGVRVASALVLAPLCVAAIWLGGPVWQAVLAVAVVGLGVEWAGLCDVKPLSPRGVALPVCLLLAGVVASFWPPLVAVAALLGLGCFVGVASRRVPLGAGVLYLGVAYLSLIMLRHGQAGWQNVFFLVCVVWASDIGAYVAGRLFGGPRLAPLLSPGKTWSGAAGGLACGLAAGVLVAQALAGGGIARPASIALVLSLVEQAGDLLESAIKRHFGKKDSGNIIPGHGGLLDRLDGLLAAAPVAVLISLAAGQGARLWQ